MTLHRPNHWRAILTMLSAVGVFALMDAGMKRLSATYPPLQVTFIRSAMSLPFIVGSIVWARAWKQLRVSSPLLHGLRGVVGLLMLITFVKAVSLQGLTDTYAVFMCAPLMIVALSQVFLREHVALRRWVAILAGFAGVLIALQPRSSGLVSLGGVLALACALCYALSAVSIRFLGRKDSSYALVFWYMVGVALLSGVLSLSVWRPIQAAHWPIVLAVGALGAAGQHLFTSAFRHAPGSVIAPLEYTALLWGTLLDRFVFSIRPTPHVILGAAVIVLGGCYLAWDERHTGRG